MACPQASWSVTTSQQSPCIVVQQVDNSCNQTYGPISPPTSEMSFVPTGSNVTLCTCSWASYNLLSACMFCTSPSPALVSWDEWTTNCGNMISTTYFPPGITSNLSIPYYASYNPNNYPNGTFSSNIASGLANGKPDLTGAPISSASSSSSSSSSSSTSPVGAIVGGIVGGIVLLFLFCGFFLFIFCRRRRRAASRNASHFIVAATKDIAHAPVAPSGYPQASALMSTSPYSPRSNGMPGVQTSSLHSLRIASPTSPGHGVPLSSLSPTVLSMSSPINDAADVITPFLATQSANPPSTSRTEKNAPVSPEPTLERATSPQSQRSRMNPPPYTPTSPPSSHTRSESSASRRISISRHVRQGGGSRDTTISSVMGNQKQPRAKRMRTGGSVDSTGSMATTASAGDYGAGRSMRTALERITTSAASRGPSV